VIVAAHARKGCLGHVASHTTAARAFRPMKQMSRGIFNVAGVAGEAGLVRVGAREFVPSGRSVAMDAVELARGEARADEP
jgi:hypothetical protein